MQPYAFFERPFPSANSILLHGIAPILVDTGFGSDIPQLEQWLHAQGVPPEHLSLIVNTHYHSDHVGGNRWFQQAHGTPIAASAHDAELVNTRDPAVCAAEWLCQPVEAYRVDRVVERLLDTGEQFWTVISSPGHTRGHISLWNDATRTLIVGDVAHAGDIGWLNPTLEGTDCLEQSIASLEQLDLLMPQLALSGHGPAITDPTTAFARARKKLEKLRDDPEAVAWHAAKRIFAYALMIEDGLSREAVMPYLLAAPWVMALARTPMGQTPDAFAEKLLTEMLRSGAAEWVGDDLKACGPHHPPPKNWSKTPTLPAEWTD